MGNLGGRRILIPGSPLVAALWCLAGCPQYGVLGEGASVSLGLANRGALVNGHRLPERGEGYFVPGRWRARGNLYGTEELVRLVVYLGRRVDDTYPDAAIAVADLSPAKGGPSYWHHSHQTGRDVDLLFFATDDSGRPVIVDHMRRFAGDDSIQPRSGKPAQSHRFRFDLERNWFLVRAIVENPVADVQYIFVYDPLRQALLDYAGSIGEAPYLVARAGHLLKQPSTARHNDHFHVRIYCSQHDQSLGCDDYGVLRWTKKGRKYGAEKPRAPAPVAVHSALAELPAMLALSGLPFRP